MNNVGATTLTLLLALLPAAGCIRVIAKDVEPQFTDNGLELPGDPYDHLAAPEYSKGRISGFMELFVQADEFVDKAAPRAALPPRFANAEKLPLPSGLTPAIQMVVDMSQLDEGRTFEDVVAAVEIDNASAIVAMPTAGLILLKAPAGGSAQAALQKTLKGRSVAGTRLANLARFSVIDAVPEPVAVGEVLPPEGGSRVTWVAPSPPPAAPPPETGVLPIDNITTSYAEISLNGEKVGVIPPLAKARINNLSSGIYDVGYLLPNGFTWVEKLQTRTDLGPRVRIDANRIVLTEKIFFDVDRDSIQLRSLALIDEIAELLADNTGLQKIRIEGHTDSDGSTAYNLDLSTRRAAAVVAALVERGIDARRLAPEGFGESRPLATNATPAGKAANRRVEFHIVSRTGE
jgi:outer membrane protein OmpA-like peptidoglycan-associated protein